jgi:hypothetical protein
MQIMGTQKRVLDAKHLAILTSMISLVSTYQNQG